MKGLIPAAGLGSRLFPFTLTRPKTLLPILGKPVLHYVLQIFTRIGIKEIGIVVSPNYQKSIEAYVSDKYAPKISYIKQKEPLGLAHAIITSNSFINHESCLIVNGDAILEGNWHALIEFHRRMKAMTTLGLCKIPEPERFGTAQLDGNHVIKIVEKPEIPFSPLASASTYLIEPHVLDFIKRIRPSKRGEYDIADVFSLLIEENELVIGYELDKWIDVGRAWDYLDANMYFLKKISKEVHGSVKLGNNTYIKNSLIDKDSKIGENCKIMHSYIDENVTIGDNSVIERSVVLSSTKIGENVLIKNSVIGEHCIIGNFVRFLDRKDNNQEIHVTLKGKLVNTKRTRLGSFIADKMTINESEVIPPGSIYIEVGKRS